MCGVRETSSVERRFCSSVFHVMYVVVSRSEPSETVFEVPPSRPDGLHTAVCGVERAISCFLKSAWISTSVVAALFL